MTFHGVFADAMNLPCICDISWMSLHCDDVTRGPHRLQDYLSLISVHLLCCALKPSKLWNMSNILPSLVLPSKIFRALFQHSTIRVRCSKDFPLNFLPSLVQRLKICLSISLHSAISDGKLQGVRFNFWASAWRFACQFPYILPSVMLCSKVLFYSSAVHHLWCYASRSSFQLTRFYDH